MDHQPTTITLVVGDDTTTSTRFEFPKSMSFLEALEAVIRARNELTRQINEHMKCPMFSREGKSG